MEHKQKKYRKRHVIDRHVDKTKQENSYMKLKIEEDSKKRFGEIEVIAKQIYKLKRMLELYQRKKATKSDLESLMRIDKISRTAATELAELTGKDIYELLVIAELQHIMREMSIEEAKLCAKLVEKEEYMQRLQQKIDTRWVETLKTRIINKRKQQSKEVMIKIRLQMKEVTRKVLLKQQQRKKKLIRKEQKEKEKNKKNSRVIKGKDVEKKRMEHILEKLKKESRPTLLKEDQEAQKGDKGKSKGKKKTRLTQNRIKRKEVKLDLNERKPETRNQWKNWKKKKKNSVEIQDSEEELQLNMLSKSLIRPKKKIVRFWYMLWKGWIKVRYKEVWKNYYKNIEVLRKKKKLYQKEKYGKKEKRKKKVVIKDIATRSKKHRAVREHSKLRAVHKEEKEKEESRIQKRGIEEVLRWIRGSKVINWCKI
jgi:hypothetical protein